MKFAIIAAVVLALLAFAARFNFVSLSYSRLASSTHVSIAEKARQGDLVSHVEIE